MFKCPECDSKAVRVEASCMVTFYDEGAWGVDAYDYSDDGYAECLNEDCLHAGIVVDFRSRT